MQITDIKFLGFLSWAAACAFAFIPPAQADTAQKPYTTMEALGKALFFDVNLSKNRTQSCSTCHTPDAGFVDPHETDVGKAVSLGDDGKSLGDRNTPTASYARFSPPFHKNKAGVFVGGQFLDGRELNLQGQAGGPPLNSIEMGMPDKASVVARLKENPLYISAFARLFDKPIFDDSEKAYAAMTKAIAAFEKTEFFSPFTSKYDRSLRGAYKLTNQEELGRLLFFSRQFTNCNICHQLRKLPGGKQETFSNYEFHNIGVPANLAARRYNGVAKGHIDHGLLNNPMVDDKSQDGKFKTPTLRNIAVTGPYMHNGVFKDLRTVILFYNKYNSISKKRHINPETTKQWRTPEVPANLSIKELETGPALDDKRVDALVAFLKTLTDKRYEHLLNDKRYINERQK